MNVIPVLCDALPGRHVSDGHAASLLLLPLPIGTLVDEILRAVEQVSPAGAYVLPSFHSAPTYVNRLALSAPSITVLETMRKFNELVATLDATDVLLLVSAEFYPATGVDFRALQKAMQSAPQTPKHLVGLEASSQHAHEVVQSTAEGSVIRIQRLFEPAAGQLPTGVIASAIPVGCLQMMREISVDSPNELRRVLAVHGIPSQDIRCEQPCFNLSEEGSLLTFIERRMNARTEMRAPRAYAVACEQLRSPHAKIDTSARLIGPVSVHAHAVIEANALIIGPTVIGLGAHVEHDAVVAQCVLMPAAVVVAGDTQRHRVIEARQMATPPVPQRRHTGISRSAIETADVLAAHKYLAIRMRIEPVLAAVMLVLAVPLLALIALFIKFTSRGPVLFADAREGKDGRIFWCQKFRTMRVDAEAIKPALASLQQMDGPHFKLPDDPRATPVGLILRRLNIDELPQLWNVVRGEMSLVGPRPSPFNENQICVPWRLGRLRVNPGITGLWQICRRDRARGDFHQWIHYDLTYVRHVSFLVDVKILVATVLTLGGRWPTSLSWILGHDASSSRHAAQSREGVRTAAAR